MPGLDDPRAGHLVDGRPGVEAATGALGDGLSIGAGIAEAARLDGSDRRTVVVLGDGELNEGSVWEAARFAAHRGLGNLTAVVDRNTLQQEGPTEQVLALEPLADKWGAFGWHVARVDRQDHGMLANALIESFARTERSTVLVARTIKGRGYQPWRGESLYYHLQPTGERHRDAVAALADSQ